MQDFLLNSLSPLEQCKSEDELLRVVTSLVRGLDHLAPAILAKRARFMFDERIYAESLLAGVDLGSSIMALSGSAGADTRTKWFLYTKKRASKVNESEVEVSLTRDAGGETVTGPASSDLLLETMNLLSFGGCPLTEAAVLNISSKDLARAAPNAHDGATVRRLIPQYEASPKHRKEAYFDADRGEHVAPMSLPAEIAQIVLLSGVEYEGEMFGYHEESRKLIRFRVTLNNVYHGFEVDKDEIPAAARELLFS